MTFLTAPKDVPPDPDELLVRLNVFVGGQITLLPSPRDEKAGDRSWFGDPIGKALPSMRDVLDALIEVGR